MRFRAFRQSASLVLLTLTVALLAPASARAQDPAPDPMAGAPVVGACTDTHWLWSGKTAPSETVDCSEKHTTQVVDVGQLPDDVAWNQPYAVQKAAKAECAPEWEAVTSADPLLYRLSSYQKLFFIPSEQERADGARWFRCDLTLIHESDFLPVVGAELTPVTPDMGDEVRLCLGVSGLKLTCGVASDKEESFGPSSGAFWLHQKRHRSAIKRARLAGEEQCPNYTTTERYRDTYFKETNRNWIIVCFNEG